MCSLASDVLDLIKCRLPDLGLKGSVYLIYFCIHIHTYIYVYNVCVNVYYFCHKQRCNRE